MLSRATLKGFLLPQDADGISISSKFHSPIPVRSLCRCPQGGLSQRLCGKRRGKSCLACRSGMIPG